MKKIWLRRCAALALSACLLASSVSAAEVLNESGLKLADSLKLSVSFAQHDVSQVREQVLTYEPGGDIQPMVVYGDTLYGRSTMDYIQQYLDKAGYTAVGAINAAFFDMSNGVPYGLVVSDGILRSSGSTVSVGLQKDGTVQIGLPNLEVKIGDTIINYNKALSKTNGFCLYSRDYDTRTKSTMSAYNLVLEPETDQLTVSGQVTATVKKIFADKTYCTIPEGCFVLALATDTAYASAMDTMKQYKVGDKLTITTTIDKDWEKVEYAVGGGELLVENGKAQSNFELNTADKQAARTALGVRANGQVVCYTADRGTVSEGLTLDQLAKRMQELGCVTAINLDGGGSTCVGVTLPGDTDFTTVNSPSDGEQRACANFLFFVRPTRRASSATALHVYPYDAAVLTGGQVELSVKATDQNYMAASVPSGVTYSARNGSVSGNVFTATQAGVATVTASAGALSGSASIYVVETPTAMTVRQEGKTAALKSLVVESGATVDLTADAEYLGMELSAQDTSFQWDVPQELGEITADGVFTASENNTKGDLTVTCGEMTVTIPVEVRPNPFDDTKDHWARSSIAHLYYEGVLQGAADSQGRMLYRPDDSMTRQEFVVAMMRSLNVNLKNYADVKLPFADNSKIASWAEDAMKAAYKLGYFTGSGKNGKLYANPGDTVTREAAMTMLARTIQASSDSDALDSFSDAARVSDWARPALTAMVEKQIINGMDGKLQPQGNVTRAQVAKMLYAME